MADDFKQTLWKAADKLRAHMDAAEYKHIINRKMQWRWSLDRQRSSLKNH